MDHLTRERHPYPIPYAEGTARPKPTAAEVRERRVVLCGTADLGVLVQGGPAGNRQVWRSRRLATAIRRYMGVGNLSVCADVVSRDVSRRRTESPKTPGVSAKVRA